MPDEIVLVLRLANARKSDVEWLIDQATAIGDGVDHAVVSDANRLTVLRVAGLV